MKIILRQPLAFSEIGLKDNQEDSLYPNPTIVNKDHCVFLMCDGMGGHEHGEVASQTVASAIGECLNRERDNNSHIADGECDSKETFEIALTEAYDDLDKADIDDSGKKMGTTMTCLYLSAQGALMAHIGDSRIYHVRPSEFDASSDRMCFKYKTDDHSLVNDLLKAGELTKEEAQNYPHKNIITRAMQPNQGRRAKADVFITTDVQAGDYFFLCCDGVLEQLTDRRLCEILAMPIPDKDKLSLIKAECDGRTKDNYTAWLVPVDNVVHDDESEYASPSEDIIQATSDEGEEEVSQDGDIEIQPCKSETQEEFQEEDQRSKTSFLSDGRLVKKIIIVLGIVVALILCLLAIFRFINRDNEDNNDSETVLPFLQWTKTKIIEDEDTVSIPKVDPILDAQDNPNEDTVEPSSE